MYSPLLVCFLYVTGLVGIIELNRAEYLGGLAGLYIGFAYSATLQIPLMISGYTAKPSGFYGFFRPVYITFPIAGVYSIAVYGLAAMPNFLHLIGSTSFIATVAISLYKAHVMDKYVKFA